MPRLVRLALCLLLPVATFAETTPPRPRFLKLTHESAIRMALARNFSIQVQQFAPQIAEQAIQRERARFDPAFDIRAQRAENSRRQAFVGGLRLPVNDVNRVDELSSGLTGVTTWGTRYDVGYAAQSRAGSSNLFEEEYETGLSLSLVQPLLRDAGPTVNLAQIRIARSDLRVSEWQLRERIIDVITTTTFVYNELQSALENREVAARSRDLAQQLAGDNRQRVEFGTMIPLDVLEASTQVAAREEGVILAQRNVLDNENLLKQLITDDLLALLDVRIEIAPPEPAAFRADVLGGIRDALALRPDYRSALLGLEQQHIRVAFAKNQTLPRIDLTGSLALLGLDSSFGGSLSRSTQRDQTAWTAGVLFSIPLGNRAARASEQSARLEVARQLVGLQGLEQSIVVEVDNASGQILTSRERLATTREARRLARETLAAAQERFRAGTGTTFAVLQFQENVATAELAEVRARADYNKAVSEYHRRTGTTLRVHRVELQ